jgi:phage tail-like protein
MPQPGEQAVYYRAFQFTVEIKGLSKAYFQEISGLDITIDVIDYHLGGNRIIKLPGQAKHSNLILKRGYTDDDYLWNWMEDVHSGKTENFRREISVVQYNMAGEEKIRWNLFEAYPVKYSAPSFNAKNNELSIETVEFVYERVERERA